MGSLLDELSNQKPQGGSVFQSLSGTQAPPPTVQNPNAWYNQPLPQAGIGVAKGVGQTILGLGSIVPGIANWVGNKLGLPGKTETPMQQFGQSVQPKGFWQGAGVFTEKTGELFGPGGIVSKGKAIAEGIGTLAGATETGQAIKSLPTLGKAFAWTAQKVLNAIPEISFGTGWGISQGETPKEALKTGGVFGALSIGGEVAGDVISKLKGDIVKNVQKAIGMTGKMTPEQATQKIPQAIRAFKTISGMAKDITVKDINGVEKAFDPIKADFYETMQAQNEARKKVYQAYTDLAKQAGDAGAKFTQKDFGSIIDFLKGYLKDTTEPFKAKANSLINDLKENFQVTNSKGAKSFGETDLTRMQSFLEKVNRDVNPQSNKAASDVSTGLSGKLREIMDNKILSATDGQYQKLRNSYSDLKSIENDLVNQFKKASRKSGTTFGKYIEGYGAIDVILGALSHNPIEVARGAGLNILAKFMEHLKDPEVNLRNVFKSLSDAEQNPTFTRMFGGAKPAELPASMQDTIKNAIDNPPNVVGLTTKAVGGYPDTLKAPEFKGFKDLTTKVLDKLTGRSQVSKQFISDLTNSGDLKQAERDLIRGVLKDMPDNVPVKDFANKVKTELLPLKTSESLQKYENITLSEELRGNVAHYKERIYQSPISTSAGDVHFSYGSAKGGFPNYFAHTRVEDLAPDFTSRQEALRAKNLQPGGLSPKEMKEFYNIEDTSRPKVGDTRRVIELQSDLFQKGRLESEIARATDASGKEKLPFGQPIKYQGKDYTIQGGELGGKIELRAKDGSILKVNRDSLNMENHIPSLKQLEPYRNTWHERIIREEIKQAAKDGKTKLQFPTGETAMKIEGLGENTQFWNGPMRAGSTKLLPEQLKVGNTINNGAGSEWIITDVLGDGKFKAVPKAEMDKLTKWKAVPSGDGGYNIDTGTHVGAARFGSKQAVEDAIKSGINNATEQFDISGKVDTNNPIYKFYEKEVGKYLKNKYGAQQVTDSQGVSWWEVPIKKAMAKLPIEAFAAAPLLATPLATKKK